MVTIIQRMMKFIYPLITLAFATQLTSCEKTRNEVRILYSHSNGQQFEENEIITYRKGLTLIADLKEKGKKIKHVELGEGFIPLIPLFVKELETLDTKNNCSIIDSYKISIDGKIIQKTDQTCQWNGFERLKYALFYSTK